MSLPISDDAVQFVERARQAGIEVRLLGSVAVALYVRDVSQRPGHVKDIDLVTVRENQRGMQSLLNREGWSVSGELLLVAESRETYSRQKTNYTMDVYYDVIDGSHPVDLRSRITRSVPAISVTDLVLTKLQRQVMRDKDFWDCNAIFEHGYELEDGYLADILRRDWGFYTTFIDNLHALESRYAGSSKPVIHLSHTLASSHKTIRWRLRSIIGRRIKWWREMYDTSISVED